MARSGTHARRHENRVHKINATAPRSPWAAARIRIAPFVDYGGRITKVKFLQSIPRLSPSVDSEIGRHLVPVALCLSKPWISGMEGKCLFLEVRPNQHFSYRANGQGWRANVE
jgi:hypothetical protein